jgi:hypothetical protein
MAKRTKTEKIADGHEATATKIAQFGPDEPSRAARHRTWTMDNRDRADYDPSKNPHSRERVYSQADFARVEQWKIWAKANPHKDPSLNPHSWQNKHRST